MKYLNYEIFEGRMADISEVCDLNFSIFRNLYAREPFSLEKYLERLSGEDFFIYLIKQDKKIVGDSISFLKGEILYIWILGITEKHRKNGLASKLLELNEKIAKKMIVKVSLSKFMMFQSQ